MDISKLRKMMASNMPNRTPVKKGKKPRKGKNKSMMDMMGMHNASMDEMMDY